MTLRPALQVFVAEQYSQAPEVVLKKSSVVPGVQVAGFDVPAVKPTAPGLG
jgi:hypothetical protein